MSPQKSISSISSCKDIVQCAFSLNDFEVEVFRSAFKYGPMRADELADRMGVERSKVYRALQKLLSCGMCIRETKSLEKGGYYHVYSTIDRDVLKSKMEQCIGEWNERMRDAMARFDERSSNDII
ncbi:MAG: HTH-type transcriptional regulator lrs14 [Methanomassiliicoccales archaeon PtaU1.Bin030]|nr:MAG: HTH-type transcriptional regulator lrs14 [Methanomassiliicoccales archaeon PtaU1.Bin030]